MSVDYEIRIEALAKRYNGPFIIKHFNAHFKSPIVYGILGPNGIGKSTLLRLVSGIESADFGTLNHLLQEQKVSPDKWYSHLSFVAPYIDLPVHLTVQELIKFHQTFMPFYNDLNLDQVLEISGLGERKNVAFEYLSSGQKQKLKLTLGLLSKSKLLIIDEPGTNLDVDNYKWFVNLFLTYKKNRLILLATNDERDFALIESRIELNNH